jgi:hypothetical protein
VKISPLEVDSKPPEAAMEVLLGMVMSLGRVNLVH